MKNYCYIIIDNSNLLLNKDNNLGILHIIEIIFFWESTMYLLYFKMEKYFKIIIFF